MLLTVYRSKRDTNGNVYFSCELTHFARRLAKGIIDSNNVNTLDLRENLKWEHTEKELPIREFNRLTKNWDYLGCRWEDIKANLINQTEG